MKRILLTVFALGAALTLSAQAFQCADPEATPEARQLLERLAKIREKGIMYGHQDDLLTGYTWWEVEGNSDTKTETGDYPAMAGCELGEEQGKQAAHQRQAADQPCRAGQAAAQQPAAQGGHQRRAGQQQYGRPQGEQSLTQARLQPGREQRDVQHLAGPARQLLPELARR